MNPPRLVRQLVMFGGYAAMALYRIGEVVDARSLSGGLCVETGLVAP